MRIHTMNLVNLYLISIFSYQDYEIGNGLISMNIYDSTSAFIFAGELISYLEV